MDEDILKTNIILNGDALQHLKKLPNESINCVMTSPPYWALRDYGVEGQLGLEPTFDLYIKHLCDIFDEVKRVLRKDGTCWVNLGDTYYGGGTGQDKSMKHGKYVKSNFKAIANALNARDKTYNYPTKSLVMIPFRFAIEMVNRGWILRNTIIWHKPNCMPSSVKDRFTVDFEYIFFFSKSKKYWFETQREPHKTEYMPFNLRVPDTKKGYNKSDQYRASEKEMLQYNTQGVRIEYKGKFRNMKNHEDYGSPRARNERNKDPFKAWHPEGRNKRAVWKIPTQPFPEAHFAVYPEEICETPLKAGCPEGGVVLDPFFGSGTTGLVALKQNKKFIGIELNKEYIKIAEKRLKPLLEQKNLKSFVQKTGKRNG